MEHGQISLPHLLPRIRLPEEVAHVYLISAVRSFLSSAVAIFTPLYIFKVTGSAFMSISFVVFGLFFLALTQILLVYSFRRVYFEWLGLASTIAFVLLFAYIYAFPMTWIALVVSAALYGLSGGLYWLPHHIVYSIYGKDNISTEYGGEAVVNDVVAIISPIISGIIAYFLGFHVFFALTSVVAIIYLYLWTKHLHHRTELNFEPLRRFYEQIHWDRVLLYVVGGFYTVPFIGYPVYVHAVNAGANNVAAIGWAIGLSYVFDAVFAYLLGRYLDRDHDYPVGAMGFLIFSFIFLHMLYTPQYALLLVVAIGFVRRLAFLPATTWVYRLGSVTKGSELFLREISLFAGRILFFAALLSVHKYLVFAIQAAAYSTLVYAILFYYLSRVRYPEV